MTTEPKEKAIKYLCERSSYNPTISSDRFSYDEICRAIDIALQEQAKEIRLKLENRGLWGSDNIYMDRDVWKEIWQKYTGKEEGE